MSTPQPEPLLERLEKVRQVGTDRWMARCPAHDDKSPSLSVRADGDKVLVHCFAGCSSDDVLTAVGLTWKDLYRDDPWEAARHRPNEAARSYARETFARMDPLDIERQILRIAEADRAAGKPTSLEDRARIEVARERVAAGGAA
ncbi:MAG: DNA primase [Sphingobacteriia bacterium]|nr:DNA primase [Sphingobacteriia bacterium]